MSNKFKKILAQILFLIIGAVMYVYANISDFPIRSKGDVGSAYVPKLVCILIICLSIIKIIMILRDKTIANTKGNYEDTNFKKGLAVIGILAAYCVLLKIVGFPVLTPLMLFGEMSLMAPLEKRKYISFAFISAATTLIVFVVFYYGFNLMLPTGIVKNFL